MRTSNLLAGAAAAVMLLAWARPAGAQDAPVTVLRFHKAGDTVPVRNAQVTIDHTIEAGTTDSAGLVRVEDLEDGGHIVELVARGYQAFFDNFKSGPGIRMPIEFEVLPVEPPPKPKGEPTALTLAGFDTRRAAGQGRFFTRADLDAARGRPVANLLQVDAGASIATGPRGESFLAQGTPGAAGSCYAAVVRDGLRLFPFEGAASPPDLGKVFAEELTALEFYPRAAMVPGELRGASSCGALVLWFR